MTNTALPPSSNAVAQFLAAIIASPSLAAVPTFNAGMIKQALLARSAAPIIRAGE